ncbi:related to SPT23 - suppressor of TY retrotransposon [Melanopsichium pennsylvanicum]|uniref:Related to SPT23 - suppressor of TY retrotransposon n=2 Tax=Melanopsichium pennsylvanicum TaxID=63383 RepID=A0AAJ4XR10_9BASI|nr:related to SPT23-suppressor of TY retrotransposon [Melanopsichium pennsylvanicum 4]SNX86361.1 related to SPT23 - suppressor of TY retrotransposon [Melanopsichium pennsylvanicum]
MSTSFASASRHTQYNAHSVSQSTSPPSLTTTSSPTSSDSTGDDEATAKSRTRSSASHHRQAPQSAAVHADNTSAFSPSVWGQHPQSLIPGFDAAHLDTHQHVKSGIQAMIFAGWDTNFTNSGGSGQDHADLSMDMDSTSSTDYAFSPLSTQSPASSHNAATSFSVASQAMTQDSPSGSDSKTGSVPRDSAPVANTASFAGSGEDSDGHVTWTGKTSDNDQAMFDSFVQSGSFDSPGVKSESGASHAPQLNSLNSHSFASMTSPTSSSAAMMPPSASSKAPRASKASANASASASSSRRNSGESSDPKKLSCASSTSRRTGSQTAVHSNNLDADLGFSAFEVVRPTREGLKDLQVHIHGVPMQGAKSRVETQIRMRIELVRPKTVPAGGWERVGSFTHIKLPPLSGTKRKSKKYQKTDVPPEKTLFVDATVVNATPPHDRVFVCKGCRQRERKRAHRKKDPKTPLESQPTDEEMKSFGIDPSAADAVERAQARMEEEEKKRVVLFNCGDFVDFEDGEAVLPTRITCYCRHHKEKVGFCVIFTMRDWQGRLIATGSTPPIMITDDHKSMGIAAQAAQAAAAGAASYALSPSAPASLGVVKQVNGTSPRNPPTHSTDDQSTVASISGSATPNDSASTEVPSKQRKERSKPYDGNRRRRNTSCKDLNMTPYSGTGQNTPSISATSPAVVGNKGVDFSQNDFWNAFTTAGTAMNGLGRSNSTSTGTKTPGDASSVGGSPTPAGMVGASPAQPIQQPNGIPQQPLQLPQTPAQMQAQLAQGSLSPTTLQTDLASLPNFDLEQFFRNAQAGVSSGVDFAQLMAMAAAAALPPHLRPNSQPPGSVPSNSNFAQVSPPSQNHNNIEQAPAPRISKLIPGEGPTSGGIEVTVLGENFIEGVNCVFGDVPAANTKVWASNTLVCLLPPSSSPGPVVVSIKSPAQTVQPPPINGPLQLFTYIDTTDRALMELALQVVGLQMTGQMRSAREVAMRVVGSGGSQQRGMPAAFNGGAGGAVGHAQARDAIAGLFTNRSQSSNFQDTLIKFLSLLDEDVSDIERAQSRSDAIRLANKQGHTLLHLATLMGFHRLVEALIIRGCPLDARDRNGVTALHFAAIQGRVTIARMLLRAGARDDVAELNGLYAIDLARNHDQVDVEMILDNTSRTGHWQTRRLTSHAVSSLCDQDDEDLVSDELSTEASQSDVDEDNVSTSFDEYSDDTCSVSGDEGEGRDGVRRSVALDAADDTEARQALAELSSPMIDEKAALKAADARLVEESINKSVDQKDVPIISDRDAAVNKSWLSKAGDTSVDWMNRAFLPQTVAHKFAQLHMPAMPTMPAINVFHLQTPAFMPWSGAQRGDQVHEQGASLAEIGDDKDKTRSKDVPASQNWEQDERGRLLKLWKNIVEEGAWSLNPLCSPPPAYESVTAVEGHITASLAASEASSTPTASGNMSEASTPLAGPSRRSSSRRRPTHAVESSAASTSTAVKATTSTSSMGKAPAHGASTTLARRRKGQLQLRDDAMLVWFWIPVLLVAAVVLLFSKSSSIFSYADLMSYLDLPAVGRNGRDA